MQKKRGLGRFGHESGQRDPNGPGSHIGPSDSVSGTSTSITVGEKEWAQCTPEGSRSWIVGMRGKEACGRDLGLGEWRQGPPWIQGLASACVFSLFYLSTLLDIPLPASSGLGLSSFLPARLWSTGVSHYLGASFSQDKFLGLLRSLAPLPHFSHLGLLCASPV